ncbi:MAG: YbjN domain-containing protein [Intrasporangiaceae bacterium]|nr:YbjN domain-containing protein [Intrasporangiaceae bacterium]
MTTASQDDDRQDAPGHDPHRDLIATALAQAGLPVTELGQGRWMTMLEGQHKRTIPVLLDLGDRSLTVSSLLAGVPDEGHEQVYRILLQRNQRPLPVHFALDDEGDLVLVGRIPRAALDERSLDELLGLVLTQADETFDQVLRTGFRSYIDVEQRWRAKVGLPPNPVTGTD